MLLGVGIMCSIIFLVRSVGDLVCSRLRSWRWRCYHLLAPFVLLGVGVMCSAIFLVRSVGKLVCSRVISLRELTARKATARRSSDLSAVSLVAAVI